MPEKTAIIFGDSIMKGTVYEGGRYRSCYTEVFLPQMEGLDIALDNRSRFGQQRAAPPTGPALIWRRNTAPDSGM